MELGSFTDSLSSRMCTCFIRLWGVRLCTLSSFHDYLSPSTRPCGGKDGATPLYFGPIVRNGGYGDQGPIVR